jgi:hypothetical protein
LLVPVFSSILRAEVIAPNVLNDWKQGVKSRFMAQAHCFLDLKQSLNLQLSSHCPTHWKGHAHVFEVHGEREIVEGVEGLRFLPCLT